MWCCVVYCVWSVVFIVVALWCIMWLPSGTFVVICVGPFWFMCCMILVSVVCAIVCGLCRLCLCVLVCGLSVCG